MKLMSLLVFLISVSASAGEVATKCVSMNHDRGVKVIKVVAPKVVKGTVKE